MQLRRLLAITPIQIIVVVLFIMAYSLVMFRVAGPQPDCLSVRDFADQLRRYELRLDAAGLLHRLANFSAVAAFDSPPGPRQPETIERLLVDEQARRDPAAAAAAADVASPATKKTDDRSFFVHDDLPLDAILNSKYMPNKVYFVWCGRRWFEFQHYLSVMSIIRHLRPDNIVFAYDAEPIVDSWTYNTWFTEIADKFPFFHRHQLQQNEPGCVDDSTANITFIRSLLTATGGMYVNERTILSSYPTELRLRDFVVGSDDGQLLPSAGGGTALPALMGAQRGLPGLKEELVRNSPSAKVERFSCSTVDEYVRAHRKSNCVVVGRGSLFPKDIWELDNAFGRLARTIFYGTPKILRPQATFDELIPNIAHIVWLGGGEMDFLFYLCVTSLIYVAKVDAVYIHGDGPPTGAYWKLVKDNPKLHLLYRQQPVTVYENVVNVLSHVTDVWRVDFMVKYGGIYVDTDTVFVRPLDRQIRGYEAVGSYDWTYWNHPFPDTINFGVALGKRNAPYWHKFQESMKWFMDHDWSWNGLRQPYRIKEREPDLVLIDPHLQIICYQSLCHPTWWPDYHNESIHHLNADSIKDWRTETYAFHWTLPTPFELKDHVNMLTTNSMFSDIATFVLREAGTLDYFKRLVSETLRQRQKSGKQ